VKFVNEALHRIVTLVEMPGIDIDHEVRIAQANADIPTRHHARLRLVKRESEHRSPALCHRSLTLDRN
jgi:hypothetical protein